MVEIQAKIVNSDGETNHDPVEAAMVPIEVVEVGFKLMLAHNENFHSIVLLALRQRSDLAKWFTKIIQAILQNVTFQDDTDEYAGNDTESYDENDQDEVITR